MKLYLRINSLALIIILGLTLMCYSQRKVVTVYNPKSNTLYLELFGNSINYYVIGYDKIFCIAPNNRIAAACGFSWLPKVRQDGITKLNFSPHVSYLYGQRHFLEVGTGLTYEVYEKTTAIPLRLGYRFQPDDGGFYYRIHLTPIFGETKFIHLSALMIGGMAFGITF
ncbi:MAG: hypothetical protein C0596_14150 [Marinilabiliales bacterium]|nr:MAG: hypothetical protein C0596_14150 [Marinilabiliales bacterium]